MEMEKLESDFQFAKENLHAKPVQSINMMINLCDAFLATDELDEQFDKSEFFLDVTEAIMKYCESVKPANFKRILEIFDTFSNVENNIANKRDYSSESDSLEEEEEDEKVKKQKKQENENDIPAEKKKFKTEILHIWKNNKQFIECLKPEIKWMLDHIPKHPFAPVPLWGLLIINVALVLAYIVVVKYE